MKSKSILVMRFSSIGDIIQTTSTLSTIKEYLPNYTIDYLTLDHFKSILKNHKSLNKVYSISKNAKYSHISELILKLQSNKYDYIIDLHNSPRSKAFSLFLKKSKIKKIKKPRLKRFFLFLFHFNSFEEDFNVRSMYNQAIQDLLPVDHKIGNTKLYISSDEKKEIAKEYGCSHVINYNKDDFQKEVMKITNNVGLPVVYDGVGKVTMEKSLMCLKMRGTFVSFGNASGKLDPVDVGKLIAPKGLYLTRPSIAHYTSTRKELDEAANKLFEMVKLKKVKVKLFKKYALNEVVQAHKDLEGRKIIGPAIISP